MNLVGVFRFLKVIVVRWSILSCWSICLFLPAAFFFRLTVLPIGVKRNFYKNEKSRRNESSCCHAQARDKYILARGNTASSVWIGRTTPWFSSPRGLYGNA